MKLNKKSSLVAGGLVAAITVGSLGVASAASSHSTPSAKSVATTRPTIGGANAFSGTNSFKTILDGLVTKGTITQAQEDAIIAALAAAKPTMGAGGPGGPGGFGGYRGGPMGGPNQAAEENVILSTLGITAATLQSDRAAGQSLATIAGAKTQALITALVAVENSEIDAAVTAGQLTAAQATTEKAGVLARVTAEVNATPGQRGAFGGGRGRGHGQVGGLGAPMAPAPANG